MNERRPGLVQQERVHAGRRRARREGLVRRVRPEHDRRSIFVFLTKEGRRTLEKAHQHHHRSIDEHFSRHLEDRDIKALIRALEKLDVHETVP